MRTFLLLAAIAVALRVNGQDAGGTITLDELVSSAQQWARENLDEDALRVLGQADQEKVQKALRQLQKEFHGEYVLDLADLKNTATALIPLLESYDETLPYALWLKTQIEYLEVADELRLVIPSPTPGRPPRIDPNPTPVREREIWIRKLAKISPPEDSKPYLDRLKSVFAAERVPPELVWIAEVESSFDPRVRSPAGAAGLFQLMPATAKRYGLRSAWPFDQRLAPEPSARAAAQYLRALHHQFNDWRLALAAYNAGEGTIQALLASRRARTYDSIATRLPAETQLYVPRVEATILRREGVHLNELHAPIKGGNK